MYIQQKERQNWISGVNATERNGAKQVSNQVIREMDIIFETGFLSYSSRFRSLSVNKIRVTI